jgi:hypothetical protein
LQGEFLVILLQRAKHIEQGKRGEKLFRTLVSVQEKLKSEVLGLKPSAEWMLVLEIDVENLTI